MANQNLQAGLEFKSRIIRKFELTNGPRLELARAIAVQVCRRQGWVTADLVRVEFEKRYGETWGPWAGALFRDQRFRTDGTFAPSTIAAHHGCALRIWTLADGD